MPTADPDDITLTDDELQAAAQQIADAFEDHNLRFLAAMAPEQRAEHGHALRLLYEHVDNIWETPKRAGQHPVNLGGYGAVAGLRDMLDLLLHHQLPEACEAAGQDLHAWRVSVAVNAPDEG